MSEFWDELIVCAESTLQTLVSVTHPVTEAKIKTIRDGPLASVSTESEIREAESQDIIS